MNIKRNAVLGILVLAVVGMYGISHFQENTDSEYQSTTVGSGFGDGHEVVLYKDPHCSCCAEYAEALRRVGFTVTVEDSHDMAAIKQSHHIPLQGVSCHTSQIGDYVVEGHVPLAAVKKLLTEQPDVAGIGLPAMPSGTPGMPGRKLAPFAVYQLLDTGEMSPYVTI